MEQSTHSPADRLAIQVMKISQSKLILTLRFLDAAILSLSLQPADVETLATNGETIGFNPRHVLALYRDGDEEVAFAYLHMVLHCVLRHMFVGELKVRELWDLACDLTVDLIIWELGLHRDPEREECLFVMKLREDLSSITAERVYRYLLDANPSQALLDELLRLYRVDDHDCWYAPRAGSAFAVPDKSQEIPRDSEPDKPEAQPESETPDEPDDSEKSAPIDPDRDSEDLPEDDRISLPTDPKRDGALRAPADLPGEEFQRGAPGGQGNVAESGSADRPGKVSEKRLAGRHDAGSARLSDMPGSGISDGSVHPQPCGQSPLPDEGRRPPMLPPDPAKAPQWDQIAYQMKVDLETFSAERGDQAGSLLQSIREVTREKVDYTRFLEKFAVACEAVTINDDEFDYVYYTYGLRLYENMPLVEPLEYKEAKKIRDFVIAIDTSGSVEGSLVQSFLQKTYNILKSKESFFHKNNIYILQCDAELQDIRKIEDLKDIETYINQMELKGFGGTDFRPVFRFVDELREKGELARMKGLIYFTDGYGAFPARKPDYETAFVFVEGKKSPPPIPPWAIKIVLEPSDIAKP